MSWCWLVDKVAVSGKVTRSPLFFPLCKTKCRLRGPLHSHLKIRRHVWEGNIDDIMEMYCNVWNVSGSNSFVMWLSHIVIRYRRWRATRFLETSKSDYPLSRLNISEEHDPQLHHYKSPYLYKSMTLWRVGHLVGDEFRSWNFYKLFYHRVSITGKIAIWLPLMLKIFLLPAH